MNNRRNLLIVIGAASLTPQGVFAQAKKPPILIGWLGWSSRGESQDNRNAFKKEFATLGWREGSSYILEERYADGHTDRLPSLAEEIAAKKPALIVAVPVPSARAAAKAAPQTPIVVIAGDPVLAGLAASHARPGGMVTGIASASTEVTVKYLEFLLAAAPKSRRIGFLLDPSSAGFSQHRENARRSVAQYAVEARIAEVTRSDEVEPALERLVKEGIQALVVIPASGPISVAQIGSNWRSSAVGSSRPSVPQPLPIPAGESR